MGVTHADRRLTSVPSSERKEVVLMSDYEILIVILTIIAIITTILIEYVKKWPSHAKDKVTFVI